MKNVLLFFLAAAMIILAGCIQPQAENGKWNETPVQAQNCRLVEEEKPYVEKVCENVTESEESCFTRELNYTVSPMQEYHICAAGDGCAGKNLSECLSVCTQATAGCFVDIKNTDNAKGRWVVGATFSQSGAAFIKNPQTEEILPGETKRFSFTHIYYAEKGKMQPATCTIQLIYPPLKEECKTISKQVEVCKDVQKTKIEEKEICD